MGLQLCLVPDPDAGIAYPTVGSALGAWKGDDPLPLPEKGPEHVVASPGGPSPACCGFCYMSHKLLSMPDLVSAEPGFLQLSVPVPQERLGQEAAVDRSARVKWQLP